MNTRSFVLSTLIAGVVIGFLGNLPLLNLINCFLCIWVWLGGVLSVFLYRRFQHGEEGLTAAQGAGLGAVSGLIGAFVGVVVYVLTSYITMPLFANLARALQIEGDLSFLSVNPSSIIGSALFFFVLDVVLYSLFGALSGLITANLIGKKERA